MKRAFPAFVLAGVLFGTGCLPGTIASPEAFLYGRFKTDIAKNSEETRQSTDLGLPVGRGDYVVMVSDNAAGDSTVAISARDTRLGIDLRIGDAVRGKAEVDFRGLDFFLSDNEGAVLLRHLFARVDLGGGLGLLAGQTTDVFAPLLPDVLNYNEGWNCGNTGFRRAQFRLEYARDGLLTQLAVARSIRAEDAAEPDVQARVAYRKGDFEVGVSTVRGVTDAAGDQDIAATALDFNIPFGGRFALRGEYCVGWNLPDYMGGIGQGVTLPAGDEIDTTAMWIQASVQLNDKLTINVGQMFDDPEQVAFAGGPEKNSCLFVNLRGRLSANVETGLELSWWETRYDGDPELYKNTRAQASMIVDF